MTASRGKSRRLRGVALGTVLAVALAAPAAAQNAPLRLFPLAPDERPAEPAAPSEIRQGIVADELGGIGPEAVGLLDAGRGGLPADMWQGTDRTVAVLLLDTLAVDAPSPARQALARTFLLSAATPPSGGSDPSLLDLRAAKLLEMGATEDLRALADAVPAAQRTPRLQRAVADSLFIDGRLDEACALVDALAPTASDVYWQKAQVFCALHRGQTERAGLLTTMLREQGIEDPAFLWAAEQLSGLRVLSLSGFPKPQPLTMAMIRATGRPYPAGLLVDPAPWVLRAVAMGDVGDAGVRLGAAQQAVLYGALKPQDLAALFEARSIPDKAFTRPLPEIAADNAPQTAALLWQLAKRQQVPAATAEVVVRALDLADRQGAYLAAAHLYAPLMDSIPRTPDLLWFAEPAARALYAAGRREAAHSWYQMLADAAVRDASAARAADALWALDRLAFEAGDDHWPPRRMEAWERVTTARAQAAETAEPTTRRVTRLHARLLGLLQATGDTVEVADWARLWEAMPQEEGYMPPGPRWHALGAAADAMRVAEITGLALNVLDGAAPGQVSDAALLRVVESLRVAGLEAAARDIAVEAAVAAGL